MSDYLSNLTARHHGHADVIRPRLGSRFEPPSPAAGVPMAEPPGLHGPPEDAPFLSGADVRTRAGKIPQSPSVTAAMPAETPETERFTRGEPKPSEGAVLSAAGPPRTLEERLAQVRKAARAPSGDFTDRTAGRKSGRAEGAASLPPSVPPAPAVLVGKAAPSPALGRTPPPPVDRTGLPKTESIPEPASPLSVEPSRGERLPEAMVAAASGPAAPGARVAGGPSPIRVRVARSNPMGADTEVKEARSEGASGVGREIEAESPIGTASRDVPGAAASILAGQHQILASAPVPRVGATHEGERDWPAEAAATSSGMMAPILGPRNLMSADSLVRGRRTPEPAAQPAPTIRVTIGRIEVRAVAPAPPAPATEPSPVNRNLSLDDYLRQRSSGR